MLLLTTNQHTATPFDIVYGSAPTQRAATVQLYSLEEIPASALFYLCKCSRLLRVVRLLCQRLTHLMEGSAGSEAGVLEKIQTGTFYYDL